MQSNRTECESKKHRKRGWLNSSCTLPEIDSNLIARPHHEKASHTQDIWKFKWTDRAHSYQLWQTISRMIAMKWWKSEWLRSTENFLDRPSAIDDEARISRWMQWWNCATKWLKTIVNEIRVFRLCLFVWVLPAWNGGSRLRRWIMRLEQGEWTQWRH